MRRIRYALGITAVCGSILGAGCARTLLEGNEPRAADEELPPSYGAILDDAGATGAATTISAQAQWDQMFSDPDLRALIEAALENNQELNIQLQEIIIIQNEIAARRGEYLPSLDAEAGSGIEKVGQHTSQGVSDEAHGVPEHLPDFRFGLRASWEVDVWGKLRNAAKSASYHYLASIEAKNFLITEIIAEIANSYYELVALDEQIEILQQNVGLQQDALEIVKLKKAAARETELAVQRFQAEVLKNQGHVYELEQQRIGVENRINFLVGRLPQPVARNAREFDAASPDTLDVDTGLPAELLDNRPDVRRAKLELEAAELDTKVAKAQFYPSLSIEAEAGYEAFNVRHLLDTPESMLYDLAGNLTAPLLNRAAIKADYRSANARQIQAVYEFERTLLAAFTDVVNQLVALKNLGQRYERLSDQVAALEEAIEVSNVLYRSAHADYMEVLLTRREALEAKMELIETKLRLMQATVAVYQALGGGWRQEP